MTTIEKTRAEIERRIKLYHESNHGISLRCQELEELLLYINTLEAEEKEVDFNFAKEIEVKEDAGGYPYIDIHIELYDYDTDTPLAKKGDKVIVQIRKKEG